MIDVAAQKREISALSPKNVRAGGLIPGVIYGQGKSTLHVTVPVKEFTKALKEAGSNTVLTITVDGVACPVLVHELQRDPLSGAVSHVDFYQVNMKEKIGAKVPFEFIGEAPAVKEKGGVVNKSMSEIEVNALPDELPHRLTVDLSRLMDIGSSFYVRDLVVPKGVTIEMDPDTVIVSVAEHIAEEVAAPIADISEVKVEGEEKKEERAKNSEQA